MDEMWTNQKSFYYAHNINITSSKID